MLKMVRLLSLTVGLIGVLTGVAFTADQTILGKVFVAKSPGSPTQRKVSAAAKEKNSPNSLIGNPTLAGSAGGAILDLFVTGATSSSQSFALPQGTSPSGKPFWTATSTGFKYRDGTGAQGAVKSLMIKRSTSGAFGIKVVVNGKLGALSVVPGNPGTEACVALKLGQAASAGDRYHVKYASPATITNNGATLFKVKKPTLEGLCPGTPSTTTTTTTPGTTSTSGTTSTTSGSSTSTTSTTLYGSPSRAFLTPAADLLD